MKKLYFSYRMNLTFLGYVKEHSYTLKCIPEDNLNQTIHLTETQVVPCTWIAEGRDSYDNRYLYGKSKDFHDKLSVWIEGEAVIRRKARYERPSRWDYMELPTELTQASGEIRFLASKYRTLFNEEPDHFKDHIYALMKDVHRCMNYVPLSTTTKTTATEAFRQKKGVCQDYAHIMLAACRVLKIPCMYIAGFMVGEGASHAWVRVYDTTKELYYDIDPTNEKWVDDDYIDVLKGKDASDCVMNKGIYLGAASEFQEVHVIVREECPEE